MVIRLQIKCMNKFALFPIGIQQKAKGTDYTHNYHMCAFAKFFFLLVVEVGIFLSEIFHKPNVLERR